MCKCIQWQWVHESLTMMKLRISPKSTSVLVQSHLSHSVVVYVKKCVEANIPFLLSTKGQIYKIYDK